jgi:hypothetical protein
MLNALAAKSFASIAAVAAARAAVDDETASVPDAVARARARTVGRIPESSIACTAANPKLNLVADVVEAEVAGVVVAVKDPSAMLLLLLLSPSGGARSDGDTNTDRFVDDGRRNPSGSHIHSRGSWGLGTQRVPSCNTQLRPPCPPLPLVLLPVLPVLSVVLPFPLVVVVL